MAFRSIRRRRALKLLALGAAAGATAACNPARSGESQRFEIRFAHVTAAETPKGKAADWFKEELEKRTDGRITVEVYPNSELYGDKDEMQAIQSNSVQMLAPASAKFTTVAPSLQVLDLPFIVDSPKELPEVASPETSVGKAIYANPDLEAKRMKVLGLWDAGLKQIHSNNLTTSADDMKGKKYRIQPSDILRSQFEAWGGVPTPLAFAEVYSGLQQGLIDGGENNYANIESQKMHTVQKNITEFNHGYIGYILVVNMDFYESLPEDLQKILEETAYDASVYNREEAIKANEASKQVILDEGTTEIHVPSDEERDALKELVVPTIYDQYRDIIGDDIVDELLARHGER